MPRTPDAKIYENAHFKDRKYDLEKMKADTINNIERELEKEGHTGKLSESDGIEYLNRWIFRGYNCAIYRWMGKYFGFAKRIRPRIIGAGRALIETQPLETERMTGAVLEQIIDSIEGFN